VFGITTKGEVITLVQWKPGVNRASWELPPGGIGRVPAGTSQEEILAKTKEFYLRETGYSGGDWTLVGTVDIETGKYRGASFDDHGLPAYLYLATGLVQKAEARKPNPNEIMETLLVPLQDFQSVIDSGRFLETSAVACALLALRKLEQNVPTIATSTGVELAFVHEDARRTIREYNAPGFSIQFFEVKASDVPLGKHAHAKSETFTILKGSGFVLTCPVDKAGNPTGEIKKKTLGAGSVVHVEPFMAHTFYLVPGSQMHNYSSKPFDQNDFIPTPFLV